MPKSRKTEQPFPLSTRNFFCSGDIKELKILKGSGDRTIDQAALSLIRKAAPFKPTQHQESLVASFEQSDVTVGPSADKTVAH